MLGYIPPVYLPSTGGYNSQSGTRKSYRQALALGGLQTFLVQGVWSQKPAVSPGGGKGSQGGSSAAEMFGNPGQARSSPCPLSWRLGRAPLSSLFACASSQNLQAPRGSRSIITHPAEPACHREGGTGGTHTEHKAPL